MSRSHDSSHGTETGPSGDPAPSNPAPSDPAPSGLAPSGLAPSDSKTDPSDNAHSSSALPVTVRAATRADVPAIVRMLADDALGKQRECASDPLPQSYYEAFARIAADSKNELVVAECQGVIVGTMQLTMIPYLTYQGGTRALIEAVRIASDYRGQGIGHQLFQWAIGRARAAGCHLVQLTTDKARPDAFRFYERLGFRATHEGFKLHFR